MKIDKNKKQDSVLKKKNMKFLTSDTCINKQHIKIIYRVILLVSIFFLIGLFYFLKQHYTISIYEQKNNKQREFNKLQSKINDFEAYIKDWNSFESKSEEQVFDDKNKLIFNGLNIDNFIKDYEKKIVDFFDTSEIADTTERAEKDKISHFKIVLFDINKNDDVDFLRNFIKRYSIYNVDKKLILNRKRMVITFNSNYEFPVYKIINIIKNTFPGLLILEGVLIKPRNEEIKTAYYDYKFKQKNIDVSVKDRFNCSITFEWIVLSK